MRGHHFLVDGKKFYNFYAALRYSHKVNAFSEYVIPREHLDAFESVRVKDFQDREPTYFIKEKLAWIFKTYATQRLHYSGGSDSHTILQIANQMGYQFTDSLTACQSVLQSDYVNEEYVPGMKYLQHNNNSVMNPEFFHPTIKHFEDLWNDPENLYQQSGIDFLCFRPMYTDIIMEGRQPKDCEITGHSKHKLVRKGDQYYWVLFSCNDEYMKLNNEISFYGDGLVPELAVQQAYISKDFFEQVMPKKGNGLEVLCFETTPEKYRENFNRKLGRTTSLSHEIAIGTILGKAEGLNEKSHRSMQEMLDLGRSDILHMWQTSVESLISDLKDIPHGLQLINQKCAIDGFKEEITLAKKIHRIGFAYRLDNDRLVPVDHMEIFDEH